MADLTAEELERIAYRWTSKDLLERTGFDLIVISPSERDKLIAAIRERDDKIRKFIHNENEGEDSWRNQLRAKDAEIAALKAKIERLRSAIKNFRESRQAYIKFMDDDYDADENGDAIEVRIALEEAQFARENDLYREDVLYKALGEEGKDDG